MMMEDKNIIKIVKVIVEEYNIKSKETVIEFFLSHPSFPEVNSIIDYFSN